MVKVMSNILITNENDVDVKIVPTMLKKLGYDEMDWSTQYKIQAGRTIVKADFFVSSRLKNPDRGANFVIDSKNDDEILENYIGQVVSYGRLTKSKYSILTNSHRLIVLNNDSAEVIDACSVDNLPDYLKKKNYFKEKNIISYSKMKIDDAVQTVKTFEEIKEFNSKFVSCQDEIRNNDGLTGSDAFDELSKLLFIKIYLEDNVDKSKMFSTEKIDELGISIIKDLFFKEVKKKYSDIFKESDEIKLKDETIYSIVKILQPYNLKNTNIDVKGRAYEILLGKTFIGSLGQHFTPRTVVNFMTNILNPSSKLSENYFPKIIDPACGSGGFLIKCLEESLKTGKILNFSDEHVEKIRKEMIYGTDLNERSVRVAKMNMSLHGDGKGGIYWCNGLTGNDNINNNEYDYVITNPPFGVKIKDKDILDSFKTLVPTTIPKDGINGEVLFIERCINLLKTDGKLGILIPDGLINNKTTKYVRDYITKELEVDAIISLPDKTFKSANANAVTSVLFGTKREIKKNKYIFMALAEEIGFERKTKNAKQIKQNDLINIEKIYKNYLLNIDFYNTNSDENIIQLSTTPNIFLIKNEFLKEKRIDATYYYSTYLYKNSFSRKMIKLEQYATITKRTLDFIDEEIPYVEFSSILPSVGLITGHKDISNETRPNRAKYLIKTNDIICARMRDSETNIAIVPSSYNDTLATNGFVVLNPKPPMTVECLYYLLRSTTNLNQVRWKSSGTIMPTIDENEYLKNWVPELSKNEILEITNNLRPKLQKMFDVIDEINISFNENFIK